MKSFSIVASACCCGGGARPVARGRGAGCDGDQGRGRVRPRGPAWRVVCCFYGTAAHKLHLKNERQEKK